MCDVFDPAKKKTPSTSLINFFFFSFRRPLTKISGHVSLLANSLYWIDKFFSRPRLRKLLHFSWASTLADSPNTASRNVFARDVLETILLPRTAAVHRRQSHKDGEILRNTKIYARNIREPPDRTEHDSCSNISRFIQMCASLIEHYLIKCPLSVYSNMQSKCLM